jgi:hypothetical protein
MAKQEDIQVYLEKLESLFNETKASIEEKSKKVTDVTQLNIFVNESIKELQRLLPVTIGFSGIKDITYDEERKVNARALELSIETHNFYSELFRNKLQLINEI